MALALPLATQAGEGGTTHVMPGATATLSDLPGTSPAWFLKPMLLGYQGNATAKIPTAVGLTTNLDAKATTFAVAFGRTFEQTVLGGAHYTAAVAVPYTWLDISGDVALPGGGSIGRSNSVSGLGDMALVPVMLAWKTGDWQIDAMLPIFAPTGNYQKGRLGNTGLNYWTFDPTVGAVYANKTNGFSAMAHLGLAVNTHGTGKLSLERFKGFMKKKGSFTPAHHLHSDESSVSMLDIFRHFPSLKEVEHYVIAEAMKCAHGNQGSAASLLGITRQALNQRLKKKNHSA